MKAKAAGKGGWEEIRTLDADDADNLQDLLTDTRSRALRHQPPHLLFGVSPAGR